MPTRAAAIALLALAAVAAAPIPGAAPAAAAAEAWAVDPAASRLAVTVTQGGRPLEGRFERFAAEVRFSPDDLPGSAVLVRVEVGSFASGDPARDGQARGPVWLDAAGHGTATYRTLAFRPLGGDRYEVDAELTLRGVARRVTHDATIAVGGDGARASGTVPVLRADFGVGAGADPDGRNVGLEVAVAFDVRAARAPGAG